jgi:hypothetical protein
MSYKDTFRPKNVKDPTFLEDLIHQLKTQFNSIGKSGTNTSTQVIVRGGGSGGVTVISSEDRIRVNKINGMAVNASGTIISFLTDCSPAKTYPHNSYLILVPSGGCWREENGEKIDISCEFSDLTSTGFKATPAETGRLNFQTVLI